MKLITKLMIAITVLNLVSMERFEFDCVYGGKEVIEITSTDIMNENGEANILVESSLKGFILMPDCLLNSISVEHKLDHLTNLYRERVLVYFSCISNIFYTYIDLDTIRSIYDYLNQNYNFQINGLNISHFKALEQEEDFFGTFKQDEKGRRESLYDESFKMLATLMTEAKRLQALLDIFDKTKLNKLGELLITFLVDARAVDFILSLKTNNQIQYEVDNINFEIHHNEYMIHRLIYSLKRNGSFQGSLATFMHILTTSSTVTVNDFNISLGKYGKPIRLGRKFM
jgi:hypothetical protein